MNIVVLLNGQYDAEQEAMLTNINLEGRSLLEIGFVLGEKSDSTVTALAVGPTVDERVLREAFAMGATRAVAKEGVEPTDVKAVADVLVAVGADVVVAPNTLADELGPVDGKSVVTYDAAMAVAPSVVKPGEAVLTPRHMNVKGVFTAYDKTIEAM